MNTTLNIACPFLLEQWKEGKKAEVVKQLGGTTAYVAGFMLYLAQQGEIDIATEVTKELLIAEDWLESN